MDKKQEAAVLEGIEKISAIFHNMSPSARTIRMSAEYPRRLKMAFKALGRGYALPNNAGLNAEWQENPQLGASYKDAIAISDGLKAINAAEIKQSGPEHLKRLLRNPASYNPSTKVRKTSHGSHFPIYD